MLDAVATASLFASSSSLKDDDGKDDVVGDGVLPAEEEDGIAG